MSFSSFFDLLKKTYTAWNEDKAPRLGAALSYYTVFSLAPMLVVLIGILSLHYSREAATGEIVKQLESTIGKTAAVAVKEMINNANHGGHGKSVVATIIGFITVLAGAGGLFAQLQDSLNTIWGVQPKPDAGIWFMLRTRFVSFAMVLGVGFLLVVSLALSAALAALSTWMGNYFPGPDWIPQVLNFVIGFLVILLLFAAMFKVLPDVEIDWRDVWIGAAVTSFLFSAGKLALGLYLGRPGVESAYGSAGALVILLLWVYYAAQIMFFGAEFTKVYANEFGSHIVPSEHAEAISPAARANQGLKPVPTHGLPAGSKAATPKGATATAKETKPATAPQVSEAQRQNFEHGIAVVAGAALTLLWAWNRSRGKQQEI